MKLSISNIAWDKEYDDEILEYISNKGFKAIEIAPTRLINEDPYNHISEFVKIVKEIRNKYNIEISSMQSIWFGISGNIFNENEVQNLIEYTKKAIDLASEINCKNLVFGCPKNRIKPESKIDDDIIYFFKEVGDYAKEKNTVLSLEANPVIYNTNFINYTKEAIDFVKKVNSDGFKVNVDYGTIIENNEDIDIIINNIDLVNHIHISEPYLNKILKRESHIFFANMLKNKNYQKYISIEMKKLDNIDELKEIIDYVYDTFN